MAAIDGLSSGLDTSTIISQLMALERVPQSRLKTQQSAAESSITSLRTLNTKFLSIISAAEKLGAGKPLVEGAVAKPSDWQLTSASTNDATRASASAVTGAGAGELRFNVKQLATAGTYLSASITAPTSTTAGAVPTGLLLSKGDGEPVAIDNGDGSLAATVSAINKAGLGIAASLVQVTVAEGDSPAQYRLQLTSTTTGADSSISVKSPDGTALPAAASTAGQDAVLDLGNGVTVARPTNTISDVLEGVTLTLKKADKPVVGGGYEEPPVILTVKRDADGVAARVQALVDIANTTRTEVKSLTAVDASGSRGRLYGDSAIRSLSDMMRTAVSAGSAGPGLAGVTVGRDGTVSFDKEKFRKALEADPAAVEAALGKDGMAGRLFTLADQVSRSASAVGGAGLITSAITSKESQIASFKSGIESWDSRLAMKEKMLQRQYTALETALGKAQSQGQWLSGQLANLPKWSS